MHFVLYKVLNLSKQLKLKHMKKALLVTLAIYSIIAVVTLINWNLI